MGASQSSNVASAVANVTNDIANKTTANTQQAAQITQRITTNGCIINADNYTAVESANTVQSNTQLTTALQKADVTNDIQQKLLQEATSTVGSMGIGYADASNSASMFVNSTTQITNAMETSCNQYSNTNQSWTCDRSTINAKNININLGSTSKFLSDQVLNNSQVATVVNNVSQSATQKATSTVEGLTGFLIAVALIIAALGYSLSKPLDSAPVKFFVGFIVIGVLVFILIYVIINKKYPFNEYTQCSPIDNILNYSNCDQCLEIENKSVTLNQTPLRYIHDLTPSQHNSPSGANLMQMIISFYGKDTANGGYNRVNKIRIDQKIKSYDPLAKKLGIDNIPPLLVVPMDSSNVFQIPDVFLKSGTGPNASICTPASFVKHINGKPIGDWSSCPQTGTIPNSVVDPGNDNDTIMANLNDTDWSTGSGNYFDPSNAEVSLRSQFARYVLCDMLSVIPLTIYISEDELINTVIDGNNITDQAKNLKGHCYQFKTSNTDFLSAITQGGTMIGPFGTCHNSEYKTKKALRITIIVTLCVIPLLFIGIMIWKRSGSTIDSSTPVSEPQYIEMTQTKK